MFTGPKILVVTFWRSILYIICIILLLFINSDNKSPTPLLFNVLNVFTQLTLISLFFSLITILKKIKEKKVILISFILYPALILLAMLNSLVFKSPPLAASAIITGGLTILVTINLLIQAFRMRKSYITVYYRVLAITLLTILFSKIISPIILTVVYKSDNESFVNTLKISSLLNLAFFLFVPVTIILMVYKIKKIRLVPAE